VLTPSKGLAVDLEERDSSQPEAAQNDKMLALSGCQPMHSHVICHVLTLAICQVQGSARRDRSASTSAPQTWDGHVDLTY
jgi:hypothetical protein